MSFSEAEVARVARLARLTLAPGEAEILSRQLAAIAHEFEGLAGYAQDLPEPAPEQAGTLREDLVEPSDPDVLARAPRRQKDGSIRAGAGG